jgi:nitrate/nitrite-specific signal transduction histidine kinase
MGSVNMQTYRSVKAIQSKIYQIKQDSEKDLEEFENLKDAILKKKTPKKIKKIAETLEKTTLDDENGNEPQTTNITQKPAQAEPLVSK